MSTEYSKIKYAPKELFKVPEPMDVRAKYKDITLNFGKYKGKTLDEVISDEKGPKYLTWLHSEMTKKDSLTPTQKAIMKYTVSMCEI